MPAPALALAGLLTFAQAPAAEDPQPESPAVDPAPADEPQLPQPAATQPPATSQPTSATSQQPAATSQQPVPPAATQPPAATSQRSTPTTATQPPATSQPSAPASATSPPTATSQQPAPTEARPRWWGPSPRPKVSGYGGPVLRLSGLHGAFAAFVGLEGGLNIIQRVTIGATLQWLLNPVEAGAFSKGAATRINLNYGGLAVDVAYVKGERVAGTLGGVLGGGGACIQNPENGDCADKTAFFVGEPRAGLRVVLAPIVRLHLAFGWRLVAARTWTGPAALGGPAGTVALEFGWF